MKKKWIYLGLFFDEDSKKELMRRIGDKIPEGWTPYMDHVTVAFNDDVAKQDEVFWDFKQNMLGKRYIVDIRSIGLSDRAMAGRVSNLKTNKYIFAASRHSKSCTNLPISVALRVAPFT